MKNNKIKSILAIFCAFSVALSMGGILVSSKLNAKSPEIVLAEEEENNNDSSQEESSNEQEAPASETENQTSEENISENNEVEESTSEEEAAPLKVEPADIFKILAQTFRDAFLDLIEHFKRWFKIK